MFVFTRELNRSVKNQNSHVIVSILLIILRMFDHLFHLKVNVLSLCLRVQVMFTQSYNGSKIVMTIRIYWNWILIVLQVTAYAMRRYFRKQIIKK